MSARKRVQQNLAEHQCFVKCYATEAHFIQELVAPTCALPLNFSYTSPFSTENIYTDMFHKSGSISSFKPCAAEALRDFFLLCWSKEVDGNSIQVKTLAKWNEDLS